MPFTPEERKIILFLITIALIGMGIIFLEKRCPKLAPACCFEIDLDTLDLNSANRQELMSIPGIGEKLSLRIIEYRQRRGGFKAVEELKNIQGITEFRYSKIKDYLSINAK